MLTGELIVFQNETMDIFKELIKASQSPLDNSAPGNLSVRYVSAILIKFVRFIYENNIPLQAAQQTMILSYLFNAKEYAVLQQLLQFHVFLDSMDLARVLVELGSRHSKKTDSYYEPAF